MPAGKTQKDTKSTSESKRSVALRVTHRLYTERFRESKKPVSRHLQMTLYEEKARK